MMRLSRNSMPEAARHAVAWNRAHLPQAETQTRAAGELEEAFRRYFLDHAGATQREIKELFRIGRRSLGIGISILIVCLLSAHLAGGYLIGSPFGRLVEESFLILGWVRKLAAFRNILVRLAAARTEKRPLSPACSGDSRAKIIRRSESQRALTDVR